MVKKRKLKTNIKIGAVAILATTALGTSIHAIQHTNIVQKEYANMVDILSKEVSELNAQAQQQETEIVQKEEEIQRLNSDITSREDEVNKLNEKLKKLQEEKEDLENQLSLKKEAEEKVLATKQTSWSGVKLSPQLGSIQGPSGKETYYNLPMQGVVNNSHRDGIQGEYWERDDGAKMLGNYILAACDVTGTVRNRYDLVETSLGTAICADTGEFAASNPYQIDISVNW